MLTASQARTSLALGAAGAALVAAWLLTPAGTPAARTGEPTAMTSSILSAKLASSKTLTGAYEQDIAVTIKMPTIRAHRRPPLSVAVVIDRSGSMEGAPLANAKAAAAELVDALDPSDAFTVITYSSAEETVMQMTRATAAAKQQARAAIEQIESDGNTCISCGIERADAELAHSPVRGGLSRIVLISDGQANSGVFDRNELADLATTTAAKGVSISTVGVGLDFDEVTMTRLADVGHGHYYFVEDTANLAAMFKSELDTMTETFAADVELAVWGESAEILEAYGYPVRHDRGAVIIPIADLRAGESRKVVLHAAIQTKESPGAGDKLELARFELTYREVHAGARKTVDTNLITTFTDDPAAVAASMDRGAVADIEKARTARALEDAAKTYETQGADAAQRVIERHLREVQANKYVDAPAMQAIESASTGASANFAKAPPEKAKKAARMDAYDLAK